MTDIWLGEKARLDYADCMADTGLVLQSPCRRKRLLALVDLDENELVNRQLAPGIELICKGVINIKSWQCANRKSSYGEELRPILLHFLRSHRWPDCDEKLDSEPTVQQQLRSLKHLYDTAMSEAYDFGGIDEDQRAEHTAYWRSKAETYLTKFIACGGRL